MKIFQDLVDQGKNNLIGTDFSKFETAQGPALWRTLHVPLLKLLHKYNRNATTKLGYQKEIIE